MRDRDFELAQEAVGLATHDKTPLPESWRVIGDGAFYGKKRGHHTLVLPVTVPVSTLDYANLRVTGGGEVLEDRDVELNSWTRNHYNMASSGICGRRCEAGAFGAGIINGKDTSGTTITQAYPFVLQYDYSLEAAYSTVNNRGYAAAPTISTFGIQLGTGVAAESFEDYVAGSLIAHGTAPGQLFYANSKYPAEKTYSDSTLEYSLTRYFDNLNTDGNTITATEMTLVALTHLRFAYYMMVARDLIDGGLAIPFLAQAAVTYHFSMDWSSPGNRLRNFMNHVASQRMSLDGNDASFANNNLNLMDTGGVLRQWLGGLTFEPGAAVDVPTRGYIGGINISSHGMQVGSSSTPVNFDDYCLGSLIAHGGGLAYGEAEYPPAKSWSAPTMTITHGRTVTNNSGGSQTVREAGLVGQFRMTITRNFMTVKNVFDAIVMANGETLRVVHPFVVTYPE